MAAVSTADTYVWVNQLIAKALDEGDKASMMAEADAICDRLLKEDKAYYDTPVPRQVGFHGDNRMGDGINPSGCYENLVQVSARGFSKHKVALARAFEVRPGEDGDEQRKMNVDVAEKSHGLLPRINGNDIRMLTVSCTHTHGGIRCVAMGGKPPADADWSTPMHFKWGDVIGPDGAISKEKFLEKFHSYTEVVNEGMKILVIRSAVEIACPRLPWFLQEAGNAEHGAEQVQSRLQTMLQIHSKSIRDESIHGAPRWDRITAEVWLVARMRAHVHAPCNALQTA